MRITDAKNALDDIRKAREGSASESIADAVERFVSWYCGVRVDGCDLEDDGDMLLVQWGRFGIEHPRPFVFDITRQMTPSGQDPPMWQLSWRWRFESTKTLEEFATAAEWFPNPGETQKLAKWAKLAELLAQLDNCETIDEQVTFGRV